MVKLWQKHHYEKNYFNPLRGGAIAPIAPPMDLPLAVSHFRLTLRARVFSCIHQMWLFKTNWCAAYYWGIGYNSIFMNIFNIHNKLKRLPFLKTTELKALNPSTH